MSGTIEDRALTNVEGHEKTMPTHAGSLYLHVATLAVSAPTGIWASDEHGLKPTSPVAAEAAFGR